VQIFHSLTALHVRLHPPTLFWEIFGKQADGMARTIRNSKLDTRSARAKLLMNKSGYWVPITRGFAIGYRKGPKGGVWLARRIDDSGRNEITLAPADDALDADGDRILDYGQAQAKARNWLATLDAPKKDGPYTVDGCLGDYIADYKRRGGKALDSLTITADALIRPPLGALDVDALTSKTLKTWHAALAEAPARLRTRKTAKQQNSRDIDPDDPDAVRRRRATANRILTVLKAALNLAFEDGHAATDKEWRSVKPFREADAAKIRHHSQGETLRLVNACDADSVYWPNARFSPAAAMARSRVLGSMTTTATAARSLFGQARAVNRDMSFSPKTGSRCSSAMWRVNAATR
jgi:hypothetical protein